MEVPTIVAIRNKYKEKQTHCDTQCNFKCIKTIDHQGILKLKKKKTVLCEKHKTPSAILRHIENPCQTYDFFSNSRFALVSLQMQEKCTLFLRQT